MIASVQGQVIHIGDDHVVVQVGGVGLRVLVPRTIHDYIDGLGSRVNLHTVLIVREDALTLYGFAEEEERQVFATLINVSGVGPKLALAILSTLSLSQLRHSITQGEANLLTRVPGIGKKTAEKIAFELKDRLIPDVPSELAGLADVDSDVLDALTSLGYSIVEAQAAIQSIPRDASQSLEDRVRLALAYFT
ncbi:MAG: Holliday junction branch migration protein RuvA [Anaerolineae bacterium]|nr:Holliday junction branch migration protein RuvA [Anaerolineae bacterium]